MPSDSSRPIRICASLRLKRPISTRLTGMPPSRDDLRRVTDRQPVDALRPHRIFGEADLVAMRLVIFAERLALALEAHMRHAPAAAGLDLVDRDFEDLAR